MGDNIEIGLKETGLEVVEWINLAQDRDDLQTLVNTVLTFRLLMSYIYIYMQHLFLMFLDHTQRRSTVGRTPLDE